MQFPKDTSKLKKHIALLCDRLGKGSRLDLEQTPSPPKSQPQNQKLESVEEERAGIIAGKSLTIVSRGLA